MLEKQRIDFSYKPKGVKGVDANFPFKPRKLEVEHNLGNIASCGVYKFLPNKMKKEVEKNLHLLEYFHMIPFNEIGLPKFVSKLSHKKHRHLENPNLIYPAGEEIYVHIYPDKNDVRDYYIPIEPTLVAGVDNLVKKVELVLVDYLTDIDIRPEDVEQKRKVLEEALNEICEISEEKSFIRDEAGSINFLPLFKNLKPKKVENKIELSPHEFKALRYALIRDKVGLGVLQPYIKDPNIEDISCSGLGPIFIEHKILKSLKSVVEFRDNETLNKFVIKLAERISKPVTHKSPIVDSILPDGSRINIVYGGDISKNGSNFTIRKFNETPFSILEIIDFGTLDYRIAGYLWLLIGEGMSGFICGETASGKTTFMNAITSLIPSESKVVSLEDIPELQIPHKNWIRETTRTTSRGGKSVEEGEGSNVTMYDLLKASLRQRPDCILVGEIRGAEGNIAFQGMQTGHPVMSTFHAAGVEKLIQRLTAPPISVPQTFIDNLNFVVITSTVRKPDRELVRRVVSVNEIVGYDPESNGISFIEVFRWDPKTDTHTFSGYGHSYLLEQKLATHLGIPFNQTKLIYDEVEKRAKILRKLHEQGKTNFYDLFHAISRAQNSGLLKIKT